MEKPCATRSVPSAMMGRVGAGGTERRRYRLSADGRQDRASSRPQRRRPAAATSMAAWCCRPSSTSTRISTRATSGRAGRIRTARGMGALLRGRRRPRGATGRPTMSSGAWISRCAAAYAHGTAAIRTHLDSVPPQHEITWEIFDKMRERWAGRIELQAVALVGPDTSSTSRLCSTRWRSARKASGGILGGSIAVHPTGPRGHVPGRRNGGRTRPRSRPPCRRDAGDRTPSALRASGRCGDRDRLYAAGCSPAIAACSSVQDEATAMKRTIERVARAGISIVSLPMCNMYLQDRTTAGRTDAALPRRDAAARIRRRRACPSRSPPTTRAIRSTPMAISTGSRCSARARASLHFDHPQDERLGWAAARSPARGGDCRLRPRGEIAVGAPADLLLFRARTWTELIRAAAGRPRRAARRRRHRHHPARLSRTRRPDGGLRWTLPLSAPRSATFRSQDHPRIVQQKSRDHYWYSPRPQGQARPRHRAARGDAAYAGRGQDHPQAPPSSTACR